MLEGFKLRQDLRLQFWSRVSCQEILYFALKVFKCLDEDPPKLSRTISFSDSLEKTLMLGKIEGGRRRRWQRVRWLDVIANSMDMNLNKVQDTVEDREASYTAVHGVAKSQIRLSDWTATKPSSGQREKELETLPFASETSTSNLSLWVLDIWWYFVPTRKVW